MEAVVAAAAVIEPNLAPAQASLSFAVYVLVCVVVVVLCWWWWRGGDTHLEEGLDTDKSASSLPTPAQPPKQGQEPPIPVPAGGNPANSSSPPTPVIPGMPPPPQVYDPSSTSVLPPAMSGGGGDGGGCGGTTYELQRRIEDTRADMLRQNEDLRRNLGQLTQVVGQLQAVLNRVDQKTTDITYNAAQQTTSFNNFTTFAKPLMGTNRTFFVPYVIPSGKTMAMHFGDHLQPELNSDKNFVTSGMIKK